MNLRGQFAKTMEAVLDEDPDLFVLLGDIGVWGMRHASGKHPERVLNIGILEQSTVSLASGLAAEGFHPVFHSIAPFVLERACEQIKDDFCYQKMGGNFITVGASFDYAALGCTHHCPGDVGLMMLMPGMEIVVPGTAAEFDSLFRQSYANGKPTYFRLSECVHDETFDVEFGKAIAVKEGGKATVICTGDVLANVLEGTKGMDVTVLYYPTILPFDEACLQAHATDKIICVEPFYEGTLFPPVQKALSGRTYALESIGVPRSFLRAYGEREQHMVDCGLDAAGLRERISGMIS